MKLWGQASFILILAVFFIIAIVIYYAFQTFTPTPVIGEEQKMVQEMVEGIITSGAELSLKAVELQGGYVVPPDESVGFTNIGVAYWQYCQNDISPTIDEIKARLERAIGYYVNNHTGDIRDFFGKNLSIGNVSRVTVNVLDNKIDVAVHMPTMFLGYPLRQPYTVSVPTKLKHIFEFARDTVTEINKPPLQGGRFFETFTVASLYRSRHLPTIGFLSDCGESIRLSSGEISQRLDEIITYTITHMDWWQPIQPDSLSYAVEYVNGKKYQDVGPMLFLPQGFKVTSTGNINIKNKDWIAKVPFPIPYCSTTYDIKYSVEYPLIITVNDPETGYDFNFAVYVNVNDMEPGDCDVILGPTPFTDPCSDPECSANIRVTDCGGNPLEGAKAYFGDCLVGTADSSGNIVGKVLCGTYNLDIYHSGDYGYHSETKSSSSIDGTYMLCKKPEMDVYFRELFIKDNGYDEFNVLVNCYPCASPTDCPAPFTYQWTDCGDPLPVSDKCVWANLTSVQTGEEYMITNIDPESFSDNCLNQQYFEAHPAECSGCVLDHVVVDNIPAGDYNVAVNLTNPLADWNQSGHVVVNNFRIFENTQKITMFIPKFGFSTEDVQSWQKQCLYDKMVNRCNMQPLERV